MFRMNFLVIMLCFVMNRPYQFYYFVPLVSFFFLGIYVTMVLWPHVTESSADGVNSSFFSYFLAVEYIEMQLPYATNGPSQTKNTRAIKWMVLVSKFVWKPIMIQIEWPIFRILKEH